jgi:serine/threonine kinase 16
MIDDNGEAVLMDFGSTTKARIHITTRQQALTQQVNLALSVLGARMNW